MTFGYTGKILRVDLSREKTSIESPDNIFYRRYIGGEGFVSYFLLKDLDPGIDPLEPENELVFAAGPLTGTFVPWTARNSIGAKSPLTGGFGEAEVGGFWGAELKHAGFDAIVFEGRSESPVYLWIHDEEVEIRDAGHIWGKDTGGAQKIIRAELGDKLVRVAQIGSGGERMVRYACVINDLRNAAGRTGMGAVMGSKNLKAVAVRGHNKSKMADEEKLKEMIKWLVSRRELWHWAELGTGGDLMELFALSGNLPTRNFRDGTFSGAKALDPRIIKETIGLKMESCYACPTRCKKVVMIEEPWHVSPIYGGPEYEALGALGSNCGIDDIKAVCKANELCNRYSLDVISTGVAIGFAMECYENKILTDKDTGGISLNFGNAQAMVDMVEMIGKRKGLGDVLAEGVKRASQKIGKGAEKFAVHVKGQEVPMHEPRLKRALGLGYAVSPTGAEHMANLHDADVAGRGNFDTLAALGILEPIPLEDFGPKKVRGLVYISNWRISENCLLMCYFGSWGFIQETQIAEAVTGWNTTVWDLMKVGERVATMARVFNLREGLGRGDDWLPERFFHPQTSGALSETSVDPAQLEEARSTYYQMMGWNENGVPTKTKLEELDIGWVDQILQKTIFREVK